MTHETAFFYLKGPIGKIEVALDKPNPGIPAQPLIALLCHPHPLQGGSMQNKVITTLSRAFQDVGSEVIRFNYRGVGGSEGDFGNFSGETKDALSVLEWIIKEYPNHSIALGGFSFGGCVAIRLAQNQQHRISQLITIAPALHLIDYDASVLIDCPWLLVQGWNDEVVSPEQILNWCYDLRKKPELWCIPEASHFFHGKLISLKKRLVPYLVPN